MGYLYIWVTKSTGGSLVDLDLKSRVVSFNAESLEVYSDPNQISHGRPFNSILTTKPYEFKFRFQLSLSM